MRLSVLHNGNINDQKLWQYAGLRHAQGILLLSQIEEGLPGQIVERITTWAQISQIELRKMTGISNASFSRALKSSFNAAQCERLLRVIRVLDLVTEFFKGDRITARDWLKQPLQIFGWKTPAAMLYSESGAYAVIKMVENMHV